MKEALMYWLLRKVVRHFMRSYYYQMVMFKEIHNEAARIWYEDSEDSREVTVRDLCTDGAVASRISRGPML